jgi:hypothetical protein
MEIHILYCIFCHRIVCCFTACGSFWWFKTCFRHSWLITGFATRVTRRVPLAEKELLSFTEPLSSPAVFSGVRVTRSLVLYVCFVDRCLSFCTFSFDQCVVCSSSIYEFWLPLWYLQTLFVKYRFVIVFSGLTVCRWQLAGFKFSFQMNIKDIYRFYRYFVYFPFDVYQYVSYYVSVEKIQIIANR